MKLPSYPNDPDLECDLCRQKGAAEYLDDQLCPECADRLDKDWHKHKWCECENPRIWKLVALIDGKHYSVCIDCKLPIREVEDERD